MESRKPTMLFSSLPGGAVEVGVLELLSDLVQEVPIRGAISNMVAGRAAFVILQWSWPTMRALPFVVCQTREPESPLAEKALAPLTPEL
jgi:hypothetical protein